MLRLSTIATLLFLFCNAAIHAAEWQWSVEVKSMVSSETNAHPRAFLWIPSHCKQVRGVIVGQHNMIEEGIFEHPVFRKTMEDLDFAVVWVTPAINMTFDFSKDAGAVFNDMMNSLAEASGYGELASAPIVPIGHSACATYPWNFAAWNPARTLAILSIHGDAPLTKLTGNGRPSPDWGDRNIDGIPGLMVEGEYEWMEARVQPALDFKARFPNSCISFLADAGRGHFDYSDGLVDYLCLFLRKAAQFRLSKTLALDKAVHLKPIDPKLGWLGHRWLKDEFPKALPAPYHQYKGDQKDAFWYFDKEMAEATEKYYAACRGKKDQYIGFSQNGQLLPFNPKQHARIFARFEPESDGLTFHLSPVYTDTLRTKASTEHASGRINITRICGPVAKVNDTTFTVRFYRMGFNNPKRTNDIWLIGSSESDQHYKSTVQQLAMRIPFPNREGIDQHIRFDSLPNVKKGCKSITLQASTDSKMPVYFYVKEGPAELVDERLVLKAIPPRSKMPIKVTVVAWQYGRTVEPKVKTAEAVERSFYIY